MLSDAEAVQSAKNSDEWIVEALTEDGGVRRTIFIDADAEGRARAYAEILQSQYKIYKRRLQATAMEN